MTLNFAYISKVSIQQLHISVQHLQAQQLIVLRLQTSTEIQAGIPAYQRKQEFNLREVIFIFELKNALKNNKHVMTGNPGAGNVSSES